MTQNKIIKPLMLSYEEMIVKDFLETKITYLKNEKIYYQDDEELYEIQRDISIYLKIFDMLFGLEYYFENLEE